MRDDQPEPVSPAVTQETPAKRATTNRLPLGEEVLRRSDVADESVERIEVRQPPVSWRELLILLTLIVLSDLVIYRGQGHAGLALLFAAAPILLCVGAVRVSGSSVPTATSVAGSSFSENHNPLNGTNGSSHNGSHTTAASPEGGQAVVTLNPKELAVQRDQSPASRDVSFGVLVLLMAAVVMRQLWCGSWLAVVFGFGLLPALLMSHLGLRPFVPHVLVFTSRLVATADRAFRHYVKTIGTLNLPLVPKNIVAIVLPAVAFIVFGGIFIMANPDLVKSFHLGLSQFFENLTNWLLNFSPNLSELLFLFATTWVCIGLLRSDASPVDSTSHVKAVSPHAAPAPLYEAWRNTLVVVIGLFAVYLVFEFQTLWFRVFPKGFHYSGYAHEGAAWLTIALALATLVLSALFRGAVLSDPRVGRLRFLTWIWSAENLILALAVFNRLFIYIGYNGMTRMRVIGLLGVASIVGGFIWVLVKIARNRSFLWLIHHQLWTVTFAAFLYAVLPVDMWVNRYNVRSILSGNPNASCQITEHATSTEGLLELAPLLECQDQTIRDGIKALLADVHDWIEGRKEYSMPPSETEKAFHWLNEPREQARRTVTRAKTPQLRRDWRTLGWTAYQMADDRLLQQLDSLKDQWQEYVDGDLRREKYQTFRTYAYQWY